MRACLPAAHVHAHAHAEAAYHNATEIRPLRIIFSVGLGTEPR
jgi:hypothetical protein